LQRHAPALPSSLDAISFIIENEIKRLQAKNYQDDSEVAETKRLINVFMSILRATQEMSAHVPVDRKVEKEDTEAAKTLIRV
jgi:SOS response regulatory protein OraA/RecX